MRLGTEVIDLIGLHLLQNTREIGGIGQIAVMQNKVLVFHMRILINMIYALSVEGGGSSLDTVHLIPLLQ